MKVFKLSVNMNNMKHMIDKNYFLYKEIFNKILVIYVYIAFVMCQEHPDNLILEDNNNHQLLNYLLLNKPSYHEAFSILGISDYISLYIDISLYLDYFLQNNYEPNKHIYTLSIFLEDNGYVTLILRKLNNAGK